MLNRKVIELTQKLTSVQQKSSEVDKLDNKKKAPNEACSVLTRNETTSEETSSSSMHTPSTRRLSDIQQEKQEAELTKAALLSSKDDEIRQLQIENERLQREIETLNALKAQLNVNEASMKKSRKSSSSLQNNRENKENKEPASSNAVKINSEMIELEAKMLRHKLAECENSIHRWISRYCKCEVDLGDARKESEILKEQLKEANDRLSAEDDLKRKVDTEMNTNKGLVNKLKEIEEDFNKCKLQLDSCREFEAKYKRADETITSLKNETKKLKADLEDLKTLSVEYKHKNL